MPHKIPPFPKIRVGEGARFPGNLSSLNAKVLETLHKQLRADASNRPEDFERLICNAAQDCYDLLKQFDAEMGGNFNAHVLEEALPAKTFVIAIECGWLPNTARSDDRAWQDWIKELLAGRFSRVGIDWSPYDHDPYVFVPFPVAENGATGAAVRGVAGGTLANAQPSVERRAKPGPTRDTETARTVAKIVHRIANGGAWKDRLDDICEALDDEKVLCPKTWATKGIRNWVGAATTDRELAKKAISHHRENARLP